MDQIRIPSGLNRVDNPLYVIGDKPVRHANEPMLGQNLNVVEMGVSIKERRNGEKWTKVSARADEDMGIQGFSRLENERDLFFCVNAFNSDLIRCFDEHFKTRIYGEVNPHERGLTLTCIHTEIRTIIIEGLTLRYACPALFSQSPSVVKTTFEDVLNNLRTLDKRVPWHFIAPESL